jgi:hypothetical protein
VEEPNPVLVLAPNPPVVAVLVFPNRPPPPVGCVVAVEPKRPPAGLFCPKRPPLVVLVLLPNADVVLAPPNGVVVFVVLLLPKRPPPAVFVLLPKPAVVPVLAPNPPNPVD